jgi:BirA family biotin operon repressor/biotin-[acetyl-CoA-carboxylase] ligase
VIVDFPFAMLTDDRLDPDLLRANLKTKRIGRRVLVYDRTASTNDVAAEYARHPGNDGLAVFAEEQTAGRGRAGAVWHSGHGDSLLFSIALVGGPLSGEMLSLTCAVAVAEAIGRVGPCRAAIKWPNDVLLDGKKVAGILVESRRVVRTSGRDPRPVTRGTDHGPRRTDHGSQAAIILGIGINCHQTPERFPPTLRPTATSLDLVAGTRCQRVTVAKRVLTSLDQWLRVAERSGQSVIDTWSRLSTQLGQRVTLAYRQKQFTGNCIGVDPEKGLILQLDRGGVRIFDAAHTHIVK